MHEKLICGLQTLNDYGPKTHPQNNEDTPTILH